MNTEGLSRETFVNADEGTKWGMTFDLLKDISTKLDKHLEECDRRCDSFDKRLSTSRYVAGTVGSISGTVGGFLAQLSHLLWH